jgi:hypothetical protein
MKITFWEKPGCKGNARQKSLLIASGHRLDVRDLIAPEKLSPELAIAHMLADPLLIRRPLMEAEGRCRAGFEPERLKGWIDIRPELLERETPPESCIGSAKECGHEN